MGFFYLDDRKIGLLMYESVSERFVSSFIGYLNHVLGALNNEVRIEMNSIENKLKSLGRSCNFLF